MAKKELIKKEQAVPVKKELMDELLDSGYTGFENVDNDSLQIPFLKMAQPTSVQVNEDDPAYIKGLKPGCFYNSITNKNYGKSINVIALGYYRLFIEWEEGGSAPVNTYTPEELEKVVSRGEVQKDSYQYTSSEGNSIKDTRYFFVSLPDFPEDGVILFPLSSTSIGHAKKWLTKASMIVSSDGKKQYPLFASIWKLETAYNENEKGKWYTLGNKKSTLITHNGFVTKQLLDVVKTQLTLVKGYLNNVHAINYAEVETAAQEEIGF